MTTHPGNAAVSAALQMPAGTLAFPGRASSPIDRALLCSRGIYPSAMQATKIKGATEHTTHEHRPLYAYFYKFLDICAHDPLTQHRQRT
jgi:hypothetical protein